MLGDPNPPYAVPFSGRRKNRDMQMQGGRGEGSKDQGGPYMGGGMACVVVNQDGDGPGTLRGTHGVLWAGGTP